MAHENFGVSRRASWQPTVRQTSLKKQRRPAIACGAFEFAPPQAVAYGVDGFLVLEPGRVCPDFFLCPKISPKPGFSG
jgi:hypothetical protein